MMAAIVIFDVVGTFEFDRLDFSGDAFVSDVGAGVDAAGDVVLALVVSGDTVVSVVIVVVEVVLALVELGLE
jgi:hypothetical protein